jgi:hypothetical protein
MLLHAEVWFYLFCWFPFFPLSNLLLWLITIILAHINILFWQNIQSQIISLFSMKFKYQCFHVFILYALKMLNWKRGTSSTHPPYSSNVIHQCIYEQREEF